MNNDNDAVVTAIKGVFVLALAIILLVIGPLFAIWSWNHLFGEFKTFAYDFGNWAAVIGIGTVFRGISLKSAK